MSTLSNQHSILLVEDNRDLARLVSVNLSDMQISVDQVHDGPSGLSNAQDKHYDMIILDLMLPGMDGLQICRRLREQKNYTPILMLTAKSSEMDRVLGLETGADDYLTKPFSIPELVARVKAMLRRHAQYRNADESQQDNQLTYGDLSINADRREVSLNQQLVELTAKEFDLLWHFASQPGLVFTRTQLLDTIWGYSHAGYEHTVNSHINRLRAKIEHNPNKPEYVQTVWGVGYKFGYTSHETA